MCILIIKYDYKDYFKLVSNSFSAIIDTAITRTIRINFLPFVIANLLPNHPPIPLPIASVNPRLQST